MLFFVINNNIINGNLNKKIMNIITHSFPNDELRSSHNVDKMVLTVTIYDTIRIILL